MDSQILGIPLLKAEIPNFLLVSDKPIGLGGSPVKLSIEDAEKKFGFKYCEDIYMPNELVDNLKFGHQHKEKHIFEKINNRLKNPLNDKLVLCFIDEKVGHGIFVNEFIEAGTIIGVYAGKIEKKTEIERDDYGISINDTNFRINANQYGGITRFIQHMPFSLDPIISEIKASDKNKFLKIMDGNSIYFHPNEIVNLNENSILEITKDLNVTQIKKLTSKEQEEMLENESLGRIKNLATANLRAFLLEYENKAILYFQACRDIQQGEQIGINYGTGYWLKKGVMPQYFDKKGNIIERISCITTLKQLAEKYKKENEIMLPGKNEVLRKATYHGNVYDAKLLLLEYSAQIDDIDMGTNAKFSPLHFAVIANHEKVVELLIHRGANLDILDASNSTPLHYAVRNGNEKIAKMLISSKEGVYVHLKDKCEKKPFDYNPEMAKRIFGEDFNDNITKLFSNPSISINAQYKFT